MAIYGIYACETTYGGLHGYNDYTFIDADSIDLVREKATEMCDGVISSYTHFEDEANEEAVAFGLEEGTPEWDDFLNEYWIDRYEWKIYRISKYCPYSLEELEKRCFNEFETLVDDWGEEIE